MINSQKFSDSALAGNDLQCHKTPVIQRDLLAIAKWERNVYIILRGFFSRSSQMRVVFPPNQTHFCSYQILYEYFREFFKNAEFLAEQLIQGAISRAAAANTSSYEESGYSPVQPDRHSQALLTHVGTYFKILETGKTSWSQYSNSVLIQFNGHS